MIGRNEMIAQLLQYGYERNALEKMQTIDLEHLFKRNSKVRIAGYLEFLKRDEPVEIATEDSTIVY